MMVSLFPQIKATTGGQSVAVEAVLADIRAGRWQREVEAVRRAESKTERRQLKMSLPYFTASGTFPGTRNDAGLAQHSGLVALDLDADDNPGLDCAAVKAQLAQDTYTFAVFVSASGEGLCVLVPIPGADHAGSFRSLQAYYRQHYGLKADDLPDVSRPRYVSYDPALFLNPAACLWEDVEAEPVKASPPPPPPGTGPRRATQASYGEAALERAAGKVLAAPDGQKHVVLNKMAFLLGGVAASGFISEEDGRQVLQDAITRRGADDLKGAFRTIDDGLAAGRLKPALPHDLQYHVRTRLADGNTPEQIAAGIAGSEGLPQDPIAEAVGGIAAERRNEVSLLTFWDLVDGPKRDGPQKLVLNLTKFGKWLAEHGFRQRAAGTKTQLVRLDGQVVRPLVRSGLKAFVLEYLDELPFEFDGIYRSQLEETVRRQHLSLFEESGWEFLPFLGEDFVRATEAAGRFFYKNGWAEVTAAGVALRPYAELPGLVWESQVLDRPFPLLAHEEVEQAEFFRFLWHIAGHQEPRLEALFLFIGYYLHTFKDPSTPKIGVLVDELLGTEGQANGGTGKSLLFKAIGHIVEVVEVDGKGFDPRNAKALQQVTDATRVIFFNDWDTHRVPFDRLFNMATDTLTVDRLYTGQQSYGFEVSPKIGITTNGILSGQGGSHDRRKYELEVAPHYGPGHQPRDEFGHNFFSGWAAAEWARFDNLMLYCCHLFLKLHKRLVAPASENLERRRLLTATSAGFVDFMDAQPRGQVLYRTELLSAFRVAEGYDEKSFTPEKFGKWLSQYKELSTDFQSGQDSAGDNRKMRWIMLAKDKNAPQ